jgi:GMP synthase-like glutamine amidotransferase
MRVHVLQHVPFEGLGSIAAWLDDRRADVWWTRFHASAELPDVRAVDFVIALGGPMSVNDEASLPWLVAEKRFLASAIAARKPVLGICLGAQLIASALGARVYPGPWKEIGWFPVCAEPAPPGSFPFPASVTVFHWHGETFDLPPGAILLASSPGCRHQAFQLGGHVLGLQFHLETTPDAAEAMIANCPHDLAPDRFVQPEMELRSAPADAYRTANNLMTRVMDFLSDATGHA